MEPISFNAQLKYYTQHVHKTKKIPPPLSLHIFKFLSQNQTQTLERKNIRRLKNLYKNLLKHTPRLAQMVLKFLNKDDCDFKRLPLDVRKIICVHLDLPSIKKIACFIGNLAQRVIEWNHHHQLLFSSLKLKEKSVYRQAHEIKHLSLVGNSDPYANHLLTLTTKLFSLNLIHPVDANFDCLNHCGTLTSLKSLTISTIKFMSIAKSKVLTNLTTLELSSLRRLNLPLELSNFNFLIKLSLTNYYLDEERFSAFLKNDRLSILEELNLDTYLGEESAELLARTQTLGSLRILTIKHGAIKEKGFIEILGSSTLSNLTHLSVECDSQQMMDTEFLAEPTRIFPRLRKLSVCHSFNFNEFLFKTLLQARDLADLQELNYSYHFRLPIMFFPLLTKINLSHCRINDDKFEDLSTNSVWNRLVELNLSYNQITTKGTAYFNSSTLQNLTYLDLERNEIDDKGVETIITATAMQALITLNVRGNPITPLVAQYTEFFPGLHAY